LAASSDTSEDALASTRLKLHHDLNNWHKSQLDLYPQLQDELDVINLAELEKEKLFIPSDFSDAQQRVFGIHELAGVEYSLWEGQVHDLLDKVQLAI